MDIFRVGKVSSIDYEAGTVSVYYEDRDSAVTSNMPVLANGQYNMPPIGAMVATAHLSNGTNKGIVLGTIWNDGNKSDYTGEGSYCQAAGDQNYIRGSEGSLTFTAAAGTVSVAQIIELLARVSVLEQTASNHEGRIAALEARV